jgi:hypothetical protein
MAAGIPASKTSDLESKGRPIGRPFYLPDASQRCICMI